MDDTQAEATEIADDSDDLAYHSKLSPEQHEQKRLGRRPKVDHLPPGLTLETGLPMPSFNLGDRIVVERRSDLLPNRAWLDTLVGKVRTIDVSAGTVSIVDEDSDPRLPRTRWASFRDPLHRFFLAPLKGNPFLASAKVVYKVEEQAPVAGEQAADSAGAGGKKGRPKGSKNRSKAEVQADKQRQSEERQQRKQARLEKKRAKG